MVSKTKFKIGNRNVKVNWIKVAKLTKQMNNQIN